MSYARKIVLHCRTPDVGRVSRLVEDLIRDGVVFVGLVGRDCAHFEDIVDETVVGDGSRDHFILTSSHPDYTLAEAVEFAESLSGEYEGEVQVVEI